MGDEINNLILLFIGTVFHFFINDPFWPIFKREPPLLQQVGFELSEVITKSQILLDKVKMTFKRDKN